MAHKQFRMNAFAKIGFIVIAVTSGGIHFFTIEVNMEFIPLNFDNLFILKRCPEAFMFYN